MKYKKYLLFLLLIMVIGLNKTYATDMCYYIGDGFKATFDVDENIIYVDRVGNRADHDKEDLANYCNDWGLNDRNNTTKAGHTFKDYQDKICAGTKRDLGYCPEYLVFQYCKTYVVWGTQSLDEAVSAVDGINSSTYNCVGKYASFKNSDGKRITAEEYYSGFIDQNMIGKDIEAGKECDSIFGDINDDGEYEYDKTTGDKIEKSPPSLAYIINTVLSYVRIIVPIIIILLGSLDFAKAVTAGKEDEMRKAQVTFIKRIIMGVVVFFVPVLVNIVMWLADIVWQGLGYSSCNLP